MDGRRCASERRTHTGKTMISQSDLACSCSEEGVGGFLGEISHGEHTRYFISIIITVLFQARQELVNVRRCVYASVG